MTIEHKFTMHGIKGTWKVVFDPVLLPGFKILKLKQTGDWDFQTSPMTKAHIYASGFTEGYLRGRKETG